MPDERPLRRPATGPAAALLALALGLPLAGCGHRPVLTTQRTRQVRVALTEYRLRPDDVRAVAGPLTFMVHNLGRLTHNLTVLVPGGPGAVGSTGPISPGGRTTMVLTLPPGTYTIASTIATDEDLGERGTLTVVP